MVGAHGRNSPPYTEYYVLAPTIRYPRAQADLDISTAGEIDIGRQQIPDYIDELARLLREIAEMGDNP
jgi:hypothetical protein